MKNKNNKKLTGYPSIDRIHENGYGYLRKNPIIPNLSISNAIYLMNFFNKEQLAIDCLNLNITYDEMEKNSRILSRAFEELGVKKGDIITICMDNTYQAISVFLAANKIGAIVTFLNSKASKHEIKRYLNLFESPIFVNYDKSEEYNIEIKKDTKVRNIITLNRNDLYNKVFNINNDSRIFGYNDFISFNDLGIISEYYKGMFNVLYGSKNDALLLYTSGSSGDPKTVLLTNENVLASGIYIKNTINLPQNKNERCLSYVPFKYPYGFATSILLTFLCGRTVVLAPEGLTRENVSKILPNINYYYGSPALLDVLRTIVPSGLDLSKNHTFVTGGDFFTDKTQELGREFFAQHNNGHIVFCNGAGNAETVATWSSSVGTPIKQGTVGKILIGSDPIVVNPETMEEVKYNEVGTLLISGKHVFKGYYKDEEQTSKEIVEINGKKYYNTRTMGSLDEDRYFSLTGRESRFYILFDGNKVYCEKIQNFISLIDVVQSCVVVGMPDEENRFSGKAYIVLKEGVMPDKKTADYIIDNCKLEYTLSDGKKISLNSFEIPQSVEFVDKIIHTEADKIDYKYYEMKANEEYENKTRFKRRVLEK